MTDAVLTVIMSCYNQAEYIRQAVDSVLMQETDFPVRLLITDDCSTRDDSREIIREYAARHPDRIDVMLNDDNVRYLANILRAKARTKTEFITLLDADDYWTDPHYLQEAVDFLRAHADYSVYFRNVVCLKEDGSESLFLPAEPWKTDFSFEDYFRGGLLIPQTTGAVFRNVVYRDGIPPVISAAVGTIHERSYEGDVDRFLMHLEKGRARYNPKPSGVYRLLSSGIWCRLPESARHLIQAQLCLDNYAYFRRNQEFFVNVAYRELRQALAAAEREIAVGVCLDDKWMEYFTSVASVCSASAGLIRRDSEADNRRTLLSRVRRAVPEPVRVFFRRLRDRGED